MSAAVAGLLRRALAGEPPPPDPVAVEAVHRRAEALRRRRTRALLAAGAGGSALVVAAGYLLTGVLLPAAAGRPAGATAGPVPADPVLAVLDGALRRTGARPEPATAGPGWRRYPLRDAAGRPRGQVQVAVYAVPGRLCVPAAERAGCAPVRAGDTTDEVRRDARADVDHQTAQAVVRRRDDGRTVAVAVLGEPGTGDAVAGRPALDAAAAARLAGDPRLADAFGPDERCSAAPAACPPLPVPLLTGG